MRQTTLALDQATNQLLYSWDKDYADRNILWARQLNKTGSRSLKCVISCWVSLPLTQLVMMLLSAYHQTSPQY